MKRLIEEDFPLKDVSEESVREKNIRHGHISTLHIWWARRPLAASRATIFAALVPAPEIRHELEKKIRFVAELSKWKNSSNKEILGIAKNEIKEYFGGTCPRILDCFAGGGSIPLEAIRLGCETYALEYNPVAVLILKSVLEYPQKYGHLKTRINEKDKKVQKTLKDEKLVAEMPKLVYDVIDRSDGFYKGAVSKDFRSKMNVVFSLPSTELETGFLEAAEQEGMLGLKGHRSVGGCRASLYNALPLSWAEELVGLMKEFMRRNG